MDNMFNDIDQDQGIPADQLAALPPQPIDHPLYRQVENFIHQGNWLATQVPLAELIELYPHNTYLQRLAASARARSALLGHDEIITVEPIVQEEKRGSKFKLILAGSLVALFLCAAAGAVVAWQFLLPEAVDQHQETRVEQLREEARAALDSGDYDRAVLAYNELLQLLPSDPQALRGLEQANQSRAIVSLYSEAIAEMEAHHWEGALSLLQQIEAEKSGYRDVAARISFIQDQQGLSSRFSEAETAFNQGDYERAIQLYESLQAEDYGFQRDTVQKHLFLSYLQLGLVQQEAGGENTYQLEAALENLEKALALRPEDSQTRGASQLLRSYLTGVNEFEAQNWSQAITNLETVYTAHPDFAGGAVARYLANAHMALGDEFFSEGQFELAKEMYEAARLVRGADKDSLSQKLALVDDALRPPTPTLEPTPVPVVANSGAVQAAAPLPPPTPTPIPYPYTLKSMSVRNNCSGQGYIHGVVWNAYNLPLAGVTIRAFNETTGVGPLVSNPTNADGIYQIILNTAHIEGLWSVQIFENDQPISLAWGQRLGGACQNGAQEMKVDWQRNLILE